MLIGIAISTPIILPCSVFSGKIKFHENFTFGKKLLNVSLVFIGRRKLPLIQPTLPLTPTLNQSPSLREEFTLSNIGFKFTFVSIGKVSSELNFVPGPCRRNEQLY